MRTIEGDLIELAQNGEFDLIVHGCNCFCTMGAGIAKGIKAAFPDAFEVDQKTASGDRSKLGTCTFANIRINGNVLMIVNAYTQFNYRGKGVKVDYEAIRRCFQWIKKHHSGLRIGFPKIGAGLAGGDWTTIAEIIDSELRNEDATLVVFRP